jgi:alpha-1,6-mannosyltransferase
MGVRFTDGTPVGLAEVTPIWQRSSVEIRDLRRCRALGLVGAIALAVGGLTSGALPLHAPFYLSVSAQHRYGLSGAGMVCATAGLIVLVGAWLRVRPLLAGRPKAARNLLIWWSAPLVLAPPMFSRDVYSYLAQGELVGRGLDAYVHGPGALGANNPLALEVHRLWIDTPAPYGPVFLAVAAVVVWVTGTNLVAGVLAMRLVALTSVAVLAVVVPRLAPRCKVDPGLAVWLGVLNPLVLVHLVAGTHNDALMIALLMTGLLLSSGHRRSRSAPSWRMAPAVVLVTLAALVKAPAALALAYLAHLWAVRLGVSRPDLGRWRWAAGIALTTVVTAATVAAVTLGTGLGLGWIGALKTPAIVHNGLSVSTDVGDIAAWLGHSFGLAVSADSVVTMTRLAGAVLAVICCALAWFRRDKLDTPGAVGLALGALVLLGPVVHPWYLLWALVPLAAGSKDPRVLRWAVTLSVGLSLVILPHGVAFSVRGVAEAIAGAGIGLLVLSVGEMLQRQPVAVDTQPTDDSGGDRRDDGVAPELLPGVDVGDVYLDERGAQQGTGVTDRVRVV